MDLSGFKTYLLDSGRSEGTARVYLSALSKVDDEATITGWLEKQKESLSAGAYATHRSAVVTYLRWKGRESDIPGDKWAPSKAPRKRHLTPEELERLNSLLDPTQENHLEDPFRAMLILVLRAGLRVHEVCELQWREVKVKDGVPQSLEIADRTIPLSKSAAKAILGVWKARRAPLPWVFPNATLSGPASESTLRNKWASLQFEGLLLHNLRDHYAQTLREHGFNKTQVKGLLG